MTPPALAEVTAWANSLPVSQMRDMLAILRVTQADAVRYAEKEAASLQPPTGHLRASKGLSKFCATCGKVHEFAPDVTR